MAQQQKMRLADLFRFDWELIRHAGAEPVPNHLKKWWFCLGGTVLCLFIVRVMTGIALAFYYVPSPEEAYSSVETITRDIRFGWFIRSLHKWASNLMIIAVFLHLLRVYFTGSYRHPRQLNWMIGCGLLATTLGFGFTGYSLVYEQLSFWGATVAANLMEAVPLIGPTLGQFLRGGGEIGANTLTRMFILHIGLLPTAAFMLVGLHILLIGMQGVSEHQFEDASHQDGRHFRFWPDHVTTELMIGVLLMYVLTLLALVFPATMGPPADTGPHPTGMVLLFQLSPVEAHVAALERRPCRRRRRHDPVLAFRRAVVATTSLFRRYDGSHPGGDRIPLLPGFHRLGKPGSVMMRRRYHDDLDD